MDPKNEFDERLKDLLGHHSEQAPNSVWEKITGQRKKRKSGGWLSKRSLLLLLLLTGLGTGIYFMIPLSEIVFENELKDAAPSSKEIPDARLMQKEITRRTDEKFQQNKVSDAIKTNHDESRESLTEKIHSDNLSTKEKSRKNINATVALNIPPKTMVTLKENFKSKNFNMPDEVKDQKQLPDNDKELLTKNIINEILNLPDAIINQALIPVSDSIATNEQTDKENFFTSEEKKDSAHLNEVNVVDTTKATTFHRYLAIEIYILPEYASKRLDAKSLPATYYMQSREQSEMRDYAFSSGINFRYSLNKRYFVRAGVRYSKIHEIFFSARTRFEQTASMDSVLTGKVIDPFLPAIPYYEWDTVYTNTPYNYTLAANNTYSFIDVPVSAGYQLQLKRADIYFSAGVEFNIRTTGKGSILAPDTLNPRALDDPDQTPLNKSFLSMTAGIGYAYHLTKKFDLLFEPNYRRQLSSMTKKEHPLNQKYSRIGLILGIKYNIRK